MYKEIIIETTREGSDYVSDAFFSLGASGVKIIDPLDIDDVLKNKNTWDYVEESLLEDNDKPVLVSCFVSDEKCVEFIDEALEMLSFYQDIDLGSLAVSVKHYEDEDWGEEWRKHFKPIEIDNLVVVPKWIDYDNTQNKIIIKINPSMAFGTGEHESTRLMLMLMSKLNMKDKFIIDVGTGSGILGIAAVKMGARKAYMCDIDSFAIKSAEENIMLNSVATATELEQSNLISRNDFKGEIILCNLTADILLELVKDLAEHVEDGGIVLCSGIILKRKAEVIEAYNNKGFNLLEDVTMGEWTALMFRKN